MPGVSGKAAIAGVYEHPTRWAPDKTLIQIGAEAALGALADAGLKMSDVDALYMSGMPGLQPIIYAEYLGINPKILDSTSVGGSSFNSHVGHALYAIAAGACEVALITYGSNWSSAGVAVGTGGPRSESAPPDNFENPFGPTTVGAYALVAQRYMHEFGLTAEQLAEVAVTMRRHASLNPYAKYRDPLTIEDVLNSRMISDPLHMLDCCMISDGGGAIVVTSPRRARSLRKKPVLVLGHGEAVTHTSRGKRDFSRMAASQSGPRAMAMAGVTHDNIDMAMVYDSFTITVISTIENLGFCGIGEGGSFVQDGRIGLGGQLPLNTDGGGLSSNHPGMRGIFLVIEAVKQLRGECGDRQVPNCKVALTHGTGGWLGMRHSGVTLVLGAD